MKSVKTTRRFAAGAVAVSALGWAFACGTPASPDGGTGGSSAPSGTGGTSTSSGGTSTGGTFTSTGGAPNATGGIASTGGSSTSTGGSATGGSSTSGGSSASGAGGTPNPSGGTNTGGQSATGGNGANTGGVSTTGGSGNGGASATGGAKAMGGAGGKAAGGNANGGTAGKGSAGSGGAPATGGSGGAAGDLLAKFSFFVVSYPAIISLSGKTEGFGGDLRFGKADGLSGADEICRRAAEIGLPGAGQKTWHAFLSATQGPAGTPVNARDRIGTGPWYDRLGRLVASNLDGLFAGDRPMGDAAVVNDLPNEKGEPNHYVGPNGQTTMTVDNHDTLTGSDAMGRLMATSAGQTCNDWTSTTVQGSPRIGHSWPRSATSGRSWVSDHTVPGCVAGVDRTLGGTGSGSCVGCSGGYGGFYCFAVP